MLMLGGACFFAVMSQGPTMHKVKQMMGNEPPQKHAEHAEAETELFRADLHAAFEFTSQLVMRVHDGDYDEHFEPAVRAILRGDTKQIQPVEGFKNV
jgi:hypothetical protein